MFPVLARGLIVDENLGTYRIRIASTNKLGTPIESIWIVQLTGTFTGGQPKIASVENAMKD